jgi:hypothetical protein
MIVICCWILRLKGFPRKENDKVSKNAGLIVYVFIAKELIKHGRMQHNFKFDLK